jgi:uncharacterized protein involved in exopolysaccharide biosynthesis
MQSESSEEKVALMATNKTENYLREFYFIFFAQRRLIVLTTLLFLILSVLITLFWPPTFSATGAVLIRAKKLEKPPEAIEKQELRPFSLTKEDLSSEVQILTSPDVMEKTIKYLQAENLYKKNINMIEEVNSIKSMLKTEIIPASNVIGVTFYAKEPKKAVAVLETIMAQYILFRTGVYDPSQTESFYAQQSDKFKEGLEENEDELVDVVKKASLAEPQKEIEKNIFVKKDLDVQLNLLKHDAIAKRGLIMQLDMALKDKGIQYFTFIPSKDNANKTIMDMSLKLADAVAERSRILRTFKEESDKAKVIDKFISDVSASLRGEALKYQKNQTVELQIMNEQIANIEKSLRDINAKNVDLQKQIIDMQRLTRETRLQEFSYETFSKRSSEAQINSKAALSNLTNVSILNKAFPSEGRVFPKPFVVIPFGIIIGFITGCSFGFLREYFDHTFKKPSDIEKYAGMSVIFCIPDKLSDKTI